MTNKSWMKCNSARLKELKSNKDIYFEVSRSRHYPFSSTKQDSKKYAELDSCGRKTIGRVRTVHSVAE